MTRRKRSTPTSKQTWSGDRDPNCVYLLAGGEKFLATHWHGGKLVEKPLDAFWASARHRMVVEPGATLYDFFNSLMNAFGGEMDDGSHELMKHCQADFTLLAEDCAKPTDKPDTELDYLEVFPILELHNHDRKKKPTLTQYWGFHGWGTWPETDGMKKGTKGGWAIELTPLAELKNCEIRIKTDAILSSERYKPRYESKTLAEFRMDPTFLEFVHAILWELSFFGTPEERDAKNAELKQTVDDIDSGKAKLVPADDLFKKMKKVLDE